jgi:hypothetical protein
MAAVLNLTYPITQPCEEPEVLSAQAVMSRFSFLIALVAGVLAGCGDAETTPAPADDHGLRTVIGHVAELHARPAEFAKCFVDGSVPDEATRKKFRGMMTRLDSAAVDAAGTSATAQVLFEVLETGEQLGPATWTESENRASSRRFRRECKLIGRPAMPDRQVAIYCRFHAKSASASAVSSTRLSSPKSAERRRLPQLCLSAKRLSTISSMLGKRPCTRDACSNEFGLPAQLSHTSRLLAACQSLPGTASRSSNF